MNQIHSPQIEQKLLPRHIVRVLDVLEEAMMAGLLDHVVAVRALDLGWRPPPGAAGPDVSPQEADPTPENT